MKVLICYFSGTGNTRRVVNKYTDCLRQKEVDVDVYKIEDVLYNSNQQPVNFDEYDIVGIGYPVHAFNAPSIVIDFVKHMAKQKNKHKAFIINTSGEPLRLNNISSLKIRRMLKRRNYEVTNEFHYCMPYNIIFRHTDLMAYKMWNYAEGLIPMDCDTLLSGNKTKLGYVPMGRPLACIFRVEHWGGRVNGKRYKVNDNCVKCQMCVKICPTNNIRIENGEFKFGKNCLMCMRCAHLCSRDAIKIGWFNKWKVNGAYNFQKPTEEEENKHKRYCKKAYAKYFKDCEHRLGILKDEQKNKKHL